MSALARELEPIREYLESERNGHANSFNQAEVEEIDELLAILATLPNREAIRREAFAEAAQIAWHADPLIGHPVKPCDRAGFQYGRDCAYAAIRNLADPDIIHRQNGEATLASESQQ